MNLREEAIRRVEPYIEEVNGCRAVFMANVLELLGGTGDDDWTWYDRLAADPIRRHGPQRDYFYWWNVVDYVQQRLAAEQTDESG